MVLWYVHKPYVKEHHHLAVPLVVTNCLCRMTGDLERDGFCEADQILYKPFHPGDTSSISETVTIMASFGLLLFLSLGTHWARLLLVYLGPSRLSSVDEPVGQNVSFAFRHFRHLSKF